MLIQWRIINGDGHEDHGYAGERWATKEEAQEICDILDEKYDTDGWYVPQVMIVVAGVEAEVLLVGRI